MRPLWSMNGVAEASGETEAEAVPPEPRPPAPPPAASPGQPAPPKKPMDQETLGFLAYLRGSAGPKAKGVLAATDGVAAHFAGGGKSRVYQGRLQAAFVPAARFGGAKPGYVFTKGVRGVGYYVDKNLAATSGGAAGPLFQPSRNGRKKPPERYRRCAPP